MKKPKYFLALLLASALLFTACGSDDKANSGSASSAEVVEPTISFAQYGQVENGMTYDQVKEVLGAEGTLQTEAGEKGSESHLLIYTWRGTEKDAIAVVMFQGGIVTSQTQIGLS